MNSQLERRGRSRERGEVYGPDVDDALRVIDESFDYICAERLTPNLIWMCQHLATHGEIEVTPWLLAQLERIVDPDIRAHIVWERDYRPSNWLNDINAVHGTAFGSLSHGFFQSSYFRPHNKARDIQGLYFVGQGTYPGIGMPMVIISSRLVTERILEEW